MTRLVFDSGALIALERNDRAVWSALKLASLRSEDVFVPSTTLAQVWRGRPSQALLARALEHCVVASFDAVARAVGELLGKTGTRDVCDAQVAIVAMRMGDVLYTSDPDDMRRLLGAFRGRKPLVLRC